jgi:hypothetical protein
MESPEISPLLLDSLSPNTYLKCVRMQELSGLDVVVRYSDLEAYILAKADSDEYKPSYLNYFDFDSASETTFASSGTFYKLVTETTAGFSRNGLVHTNNRVTYTSLGLKIFNISGILSASGSTNNKIHVAIFKDGALWPCSEQDTTVGTGSAQFNIPFQCLVPLTAGQYIEVWVKNVSGTNKITLDNVNVLIVEM